MEIIIAIVALIIGAGVSYFVFNNLAQTKASAIINEAKNRVLKCFWDPQSIGIDFLSFLEFNFFYIFDKKMTRDFNRWAWDNSYPECFNGLQGLHALY